jgi:mRNA interferase ChpB
MHTTNLRKVGGSVMLAVPPALRCDQPRAVHIGARNGRKLESVSSEIIEDALAKLGTILA